MKKVIIILLSFVLCAPLFAERYSFGKGITLVTYGNTAVIEDENNQMSISLSIEREEDSSGRPFYNLFCGNKYSKHIIKTGLKAAITSIVTSAAATVGTSIAGPAGTVKGATLGASISPYVNSIASDIYDDVCDYFGDK